MTETTFKNEKRFEKALRKLPKQVVNAYYGWVLMVEFHGLRTAQQHPGYNDHTCEGKRLGQRSARMNGAYRLFYIPEPGDSVQLLELNKHDY